MNDKVSEQISALADGELPDAEQELLLRRLAAEPALRQEWQRIHLMRDALHNELPAQLSPSLAERVMAAIEHEPAPVAEPAWRSAARRLGKPLAGLAVAASVAALAIIGLEQTFGPGSEPSAPAPQVASLDPTQAPAPQAQEGTRWDQPQAGNRLNAYLVNHSEHAGSSLPGMMNYVRIAGYDAQ